METLELEKSKMESIKALADVNMKISEAQNLLFKLQEDETAYLVLRETKAVGQIKQVVEESQAMLKEADLNHGQIKELLTEVSQFVDKLLKIQENFHQLFAEFEERNVEWEKDISRQQEEIAEIRKNQKVQQVQIESEFKNIVAANKNLADGQKKLNSERGTLERAIQRLKQGRI